MAGTRPSVIERYWTDQMSNAFASLEHFICHDMRMSHIYLPVILLKALRPHGMPSVNHISLASKKLDWVSVQ